MWGVGVGVGGLGWRPQLLPTSTRVASESGGIFSRIPDGECPSVPSCPRWKEASEGSPLATPSIQPPPSLTTLFLTLFRWVASWLSPQP